jgi:beta-lactamase regulating signal transducer with metallopeptidase domain/tetratricopeptide (TPR) repeat protein
MNALFTLTLLAKVTLLLLAALGLDQLLRRKSPLACAAMWNAVLLALVAIPLLCLTIPALEIPFPLEFTNEPVAANRHSPGVNEAILPAAHLPIPTIAADEKSAIPDERAVPALPQISFSLPSFWQLLGGIYLAGAGVFGLRLALALRSVRRLKRQATDLKDAAWQRTLLDSLSQAGSGAKIRLMQSSEINVPLACGWLEPTIVIPADLVGTLSATARKGVLVHEIVHLLRRDYPWQLLLRALKVVLWFHPLLWWAERRIHFIRERVCDDFSIFILGDSDVYCDTLLDIAARCHNRLSLSLGLAIVQTSRLSKRLAALDESRGCRAWKASARSKGVLTILALAVAAAVSPLATKSVSLAEEPAAQPSQPAEAKPEPDPEPKPTFHPITVTGQALDSAGKPLEGATIFLIATNVVQQTLGETKTGRDGRFEFRDAKLPIPKQAKGDFYKQGNFLVFGKAPGRAFSWRGMKTLCIDPRFVGADGKLDAHQRETGYLPGEKIELDLTFAAPRPLTGRVVDEKGGPVSKVQLRLANCDFINTAGKESHMNYREFWGMNQAGELMPEQFLAESDTEGKFTLPHVPPEMLLWLLLEHADYAGTSLYTATSDSPPAEHDGHPVEKLPLTIKLRSVRTIPVEVTFFDTGKPAKDVSVSAYEKRASGTYANGKSDEKGRVTLKLPPGRYKFLGDPPQDSDYIRTMQELVVEDVPAQQPAALQLDSGCVLVFKAIDADTGKGVAGVSFWYEMDEPKGSRTGVQANTTYISHPKTNDKGDLRAVVIPGKRYYGIGYSPLPEGYRVVNPTDQTKGRELTCAAGEKMVVEFKVRGAAGAAPKKEKGKEEAKPVDQKPDSAKPEGEKPSTVEEKSGESEPKTATDFYNRGMARKLPQEYNEALADFTKAIELDFGFVDAYFSRSSLYTEKGDYAKGVADLSKILELEPKYFSARFNRALAYESLKEYDKAIADYSRVFEADTDFSRVSGSSDGYLAMTYHYRGRAYQWYKHDYAKAVADFTEALRLDPTIEMVHYRRGNAYHELKEYEKAVEDYDLALQAQPEYPNLLVSIAWQLATCPDAKFRDGKKAIELATRANEGFKWKKPEHVDALAAAYAENGQFAEAVKWEEKAMELLEKGQTDSRKKMQSRLELYQAGRPFREGE